jgi:hypothetical protein
MIMMVTAHNSEAQYYTTLPLSKCTKQYFTSPRTLSTSICFDTLRRNGFAVALNRDGDTTAKWYLRGYAGSAMVHFEYHGNGAPRKAYYSNQPDGGIQFYSETVYFDEQGNVTSRWEEEYPPKLLLQPDYLEKTPRVSYSTFWIRNNRNTPVYLYIRDTVERKENWTQLTVGQGKTERLHATYIQDTTMRSLQRFEAYIGRKPGSLQGLKKLNLASLPVEVIDEGVQRRFTLLLK